LDLLGLDWFEHLGLLDIPVRAICNHLQSDARHTNPSAELIKRFQSVFQDGLGLCTVTQATLQLKPNSQPIFRPKRPVPYAALPLVDQELKRLEDSGVLVPVPYSAWAAPIVVVKKANGTIRLCADFSTGLNAALESNCYPLPLPDDIFTMLNGGTCFAKLDMAEAYFQIEVAPESRDLLTVNTHRGLFQYTRLPFGVKTAPAIFQQVIDTMISGLPGTAAYMDDIVLMGRTTEELQDRISTVLERIQSHGLRLRPDKCQLFMPTIKYLGYIIDAEGRHPDPENIRAIQQMPAPTDISTLRSFLGLISYYSAFLPTLHDVRAPLNRLLQKDAAWCWSAECEKSFNRLKSMLSSDLLLTHYDPSLPIVVAADASNYGVGAVISHTLPDGSERAVAHASRTLTPAEKNYGQIEKEALAIIFAVKKFHKFLWGRHFTLLTDHKPLLSIFGSKKGIPVYSANRLQRWATILLGYDFTIQYRHTEEFGQADGLSRLINNHHVEQEDTVIAAISMENDVRRLLSDAVRGLPVTAADVRRATDSDPVLKQTIAYVQTKWPKGPFSGELHQLYCRRESLSVVDSCLMSADRVVVPTSLRPSVLRQFHSGHPGISRMKAVTRNYVYWPGLDAQIESLVKRCSRCQQAAKLPPRQDPVPWEPPQSPWSRVHIDFAGPIDGTWYLIMVDAYSKWPEVVALSSPTTTATISVLRRSFSEHGFPEVLVSDNGTQFTSAQFADFCARASIQHIRSPPYHPQSNGQAERFVDTFKRALLKSRGEGTTDEMIQEFLLAYRTTPNPSAPEGRTPSEALMGRRLRTMHQSLIPVEVKTKPRRTKGDKFVSGTPVYARDYRPGHHKWAEATASGQRGKVLYDVAVNGETWVRHRNQLRPRYTTNIPENGQQTIPLNILFDTFAIPTPTPPTAATMETIPDTSLLPRRWSSRIRRKTRRLQLDPRTKRYG
jgi:transposase InsO family protein